MLRGGNPSKTMSLAGRRKADPYSDPYRRVVKGRHKTDPYRLVGE